MNAVNVIQYIEISIHDLWYNRKYGNVISFGVYSVWLNDNFLYVGQTKGLIKDRLKSHMELRSDVGNTIYCGLSERQIRLEIMTVSYAKELDVLERFLIQLWEPSLNKVKYKSALFDINFNIPAKEVPNLDDYDGLNSLYDRAYRDPNNPKLKKE